MDNRKNIVWIGANDMKSEITWIHNYYNNGLFIEAIPFTYERLKKIFYHIQKTLMLIIYQLIV